MEPPLPEQLSELNIFETVLGRGKFGVCKLAGYKHDRYALKCIDRARAASNQNAIRHIFAEKEALQRTADCPFVVNLYRTFKDKDCLYFLLELVEPGTPLYKFARHTDIGHNLRCMLIVAAEVLVALEHMHAKNIVYRDLKGSNVVVGQEGHVKIIDLGFAKQLESSDGKCKTFCGTLHAMAPEMLNPAGGLTYGKEVDFWALGVLFYEMCTGDPPMSTTDRGTMFHAARESYGFGRQDGLQDLTPCAEFRKSFTGCSGSCEPVRKFLGDLWMPAPTDRLGFGENGVENIRNHLVWAEGSNDRWDWEAVRTRALENVYLKKECALLNKAAGGDAMVDHVFKDF